MAPKTRKQMIEQTRGRLIEAARRAFADKGYAESSMDDFTAEVGLTRGALYHHFGDKKGLLKAVIDQIDQEMSDRLNVISDNADSLWRGFIEECVAYMKMALEPEIQRIMLLDGPAVLGDPSRWPNQSACIRATTISISKLIEEGTVRKVAPEAAARLVNGATLNAALWIAAAKDPQAASQQAITAFLALAKGLLREDAAV